MKKQHPKTHTPLYLELLIPLKIMLINYAKTPYFWLNFDILFLRLQVYIQLLIPLKILLKNHAKIIKIRQKNQYFRWNFDTLLCASRCILNYSYPSTKCQIALLRFAAEGQFFFTQNRKSAVPLLTNEISFRTQVYQLTSSKCGVTFWKHASWPGSWIFARRPDSIRPDPTNLVGPFSRVRIWIFELDFIRSKMTGWKVRIKSSHFFGHHFPSVETTFQMLAGSYAELSYFDFFASEISTAPNNIVYELSEAFSS